MWLHWLQGFSPWFHQVSDYSEVREGISNVITLNLQALVQASSFMGNDLKHMLKFVGLAPDWLVTAPTLKALKHK